MSDHALAEASGIISAISGIKTQIEVVTLEFINLQQALQLFDEVEPQIVSVNQRLQGIMNGHGVFLLKDDMSIKLVRELLRENAQIRELTEMEEESLCEIGNIIINSCLGNYADMLQVNLRSQLPLLIRGHYLHLLQGLTDNMPDDTFLYLGQRITTPTRSYQACLLWTGYQWNQSA